MLLLDHKYRELKGSLEKGDTKKLSSELQIPITQKSLSKLQSPAEPQVDFEEVEKLNKAKEIEIRRRKVLKQTYERKVKY